jgi:hypothetical protein
VPTPLSGLLALHVRRGDYLEHCKHLANWSSRFLGFTEFPQLPDRFFPLTVPNWGSAPPEEHARRQRHHHRDDNAPTATTTMHPPRRRQCTHRDDDNAATAKIFQVRLKAGRGVAEMELPGLIFAAGYIDRSDLDKMVYM